MSLSSSSKNSVFHSATSGIKILYGHLRLSSIKKSPGDYLSPGENLGSLGTGYSSETDHERKHLHLGISKGSNIDIRGYVQNENELINWIDFSEID